MAAMCDSSRRARWLTALTTPRIPPRLSARFGSPSEAGRQAVLALLRDDWQSNGAADRGQAGESPEEMLRDLEARTGRNRRLVIPWLDAARPLADAAILEVGCGTGCGTVPLTEQGAKVTGVDLRDDSLRVTRARLEAQGLSARLIRLNADELAAGLAGESFDVVLFWASLEHMTPAERLVALRGAWDLLPAGGLLGVIDTPNRLWDYDAHASQLPFFHWLPPRIALPYAARSSRPSCRALAAADEDALYRYGRSVSFHEFDLAVAPAETLDVVSGLDEFLRRHNFPRRLRWWCPGRDRRHARRLRRRCRRVHQAFFEESLQLLIRKP
ncbi:MAG: methyltransferase domain-containing protein [Phycisphaerae bacterium]|nr:methyltransferase domain-containing protein [Phycisphaerae bacterium]